MTARRAAPKTKRLGIAIAVVCSAITAAVVAKPQPPGTINMCLGFAPGPQMINACPNPLSLSAPVGGVASGDITISLAGSDIDLQGTVSNPGAPFTLSWGSDCPNGTCSLTSAPPTPHPMTIMHVVYQPTAPGPYDVFFDLKTNSATQPTDTIELIGATPGGMLFVSPSTVNIAAPAPGGTGSMSVTVANHGGAPIIISGTSMSPVDTDWTLAWDPITCPTFPCTLNPMGMPGDTTSFGATFTANSVGPSNTVLSITNDSGATPTVALNGTGTAPVVQQIDVIGNPNLDFGTQNVGFASTAVTFDLKNTGNVDLFSVGVADGNGAPFTISPPTVDLPQGMQKTITVTCNPTVAGDFSDTLTINPPPSTTVNPMSQYALHCNAVDGAVHAAPNPISIGEVRIGTPVAPITVTLSENGAPITITQDPFLMNGSTNLPLSLGALSSHTIMQGSPVTFDLDVDTSTEDLDLADTITLTAGTGVTIGVSGKITTPGIAHSTDLDLGTFCIGKPTLSATATFTASKTATIHMQKPTLTQGAASPFSLAYVAPAEAAYTGTGYALGSGETASISVHVDDQNVGDASDTLVWPSDMPGETMATTNLAAHFVDSGGAIAPKTVTFGTVAVHQTSPVMSVTLQNCGTDAIALAPATISPGVAFHDVSATPLPATLGPAEVAKIDVQFAPQKAGASEATLSIDASTGTLTADLIGTAFGGGDDSGDRTGFYTCASCGTASPATGMPIALVVGGILVRRRRRAAP